MANISKKYAETYYMVKGYAAEKGFKNTLKALPMMQQICDRETFKKIDVFHDPFRFVDEYDHSLSVCKMLVSLNLGLSKIEEDYVLAAAICHNLPEIVKVENLRETLVTENGLDPEVYEIVNLVYWRESISRPEKKKLFNRIQENKLAVIVRLADRGNLVSQMHELSNWGAHRYIDETRSYFFPMCIYAKENHPEIAGPVSILMEKMRNVLAVEEILLKRYEARELEMSQEIMALKEENATIKGIIQRMKERIENEKDS